MERIIGKYTLNVTSEEINKDNFFKHSVSVLKPEFIYIDKSELSLWLAQTFRYSNDEREIEDALKGYVRNLRDRIERIEEALKQ
jgi:hypothetical protein|nr:MAG TPA: zipper dimerization domain transcription factor-like protein [Caudoviricetes sp.]